MESYHISEKRYVFFSDSTKTHLNHSTNLSVGVQSQVEREGILERLEDNLNKLCTQRTVIVCVSTPYGYNFILIV